MMIIGSNWYLAQWWRGLGLVQGIEESVCADFCMVVQAKTQQIIACIELAKSCTQGVCVNGRKNFTLEFLSEFWWV
jgi:hypothetical protein